jgi:ADP-heptose:LPS heptosyltransferase
VLLVRHDDRIGNLVLMTALVRGVRELWPAAEIGVLIGPRFPQVLQEEVEVDRFWILEKRRILRNPLLFFLLLRRLRRWHYDIAVDCSHMHSFSLTGAAMAFLSGAPVRVAYDRGRADAFSNLLVEPLKEDQHESAILLNLLRPFTEELPRTAMGLRTSPAEREWAESVLSGRGIAADAKILGVHVGGRGGKRWAIEHYIEVLEGLIEDQTLEIVALCGPGERAEAARLRATFGSRIRVFEDLELRHLVALVGACDCFMSPDTGPMHIATALGVPTTAVFLKEDWKRYGPVGEGHEIVRVTEQGGGEDVLQALSRQLEPDAGTVDENP